MSDSPVFTKAPTARSRYTFDWSDWLIDRGQTIASRVTTIPSGLTRYGTDSTTDYTTTFMITGGQAGRDYEVVDTITTVPDGMIEPRTIIIRVRKK